MFHNATNALIHNSWNWFDTVYNMLSVHPETCQSNEQPARAAKSQEVGSQQKKNPKQYDTAERHPAAVLLHLNHLNLQQGDIRLSILAKSEGFQVLDLIHDLEKD